MWAKKLFRGQKQSEQTKEWYLKRRSYQIIRVFVVNILCLVISLYSLRKLQIEYYGLGPMIGMFYRKTLSEDIDEELGIVSIMYFTMFFLSFKTMLVMVIVIVTEWWRSIVISLIVMASLTWYTSYLMETLTRLPYLDQEVTTYLENAMEKTYNGTSVTGDNILLIRGDILSRLFDLIMIQHKCCGINGPQDFYVEGQHNWQWNKVYQSKESLSYAQIPFSCCTVRKYEQFDWNHPNKIELVDVDRCQNTLSPLYSHSEGCHGRVKDRVLLSLIRVLTSLIFQIFIDIYVLGELVLSLKYEQSRLQRKSKKWNLIVQKHLHANNGISCRNTNSQNSDSLNLPSTNSSKPSLCAKYAQPSVPTNTPQPANIMKMITLASKLSKVGDMHKTLETAILQAKDPATNKPANVYKNVRDHTAKVQNEAAKIVTRDSKQEMEIPMIANDDKTKNQSIPALNKKSTTSKARSLTCNSRIKKENDLNSIKNEIKRNIKKRSSIPLKSRVKSSLISTIPSARISSKSPPKSLKDIFNKTAKVKSVTNATESITNPAESNTNAEINIETFERDGRLQSLNRESLIQALSFMDTNQLQIACDLFDQGKLEKPQTTNTSQISVNNEALKLTTLSPGAMFKLETIPEKSEISLVESLNKSAKESIEGGKVTLKSIDPGAIDDTRLVVNKTNIKGTVKPVIKGDQDKESSSKLANVDVHDGDFKDTLKNKPTTTANADDLIKVVVTDSKAQDLTIPTIDKTNEQDSSIPVVVKGEEVPVNSRKSKKIKGNKVNKKQSK